MAVRRVAFQHFFQTSPLVQRFLLPNARPTGRQLGVGSYGSVEEVEINGLVCAGKKVHEALLEAGNFGAETIVSRYGEECQLMSDLRHPNIVQFLGLCFLPTSPLPLLVMERLKSLDDLLESSPDIPLTMKRSILADVSHGLVYLHSHNPPVIHRDLSARNVLLNSAMVAKISDLGNSRIVDLQPGQLARTLSRLPGTMVYMAPEVFDDISRYGTKLDMFSFGHLGLFTVIQVFPGILLPSTYPDPEDPDKIVARSEVERRRAYFEQLQCRLGEGHPLERLIRGCLHNAPSRRPSAEEALRQLEDMRALLQDPYEAMDKLEMVRTLQEKDREIQQLQTQGQQPRNHSAVEQTRRANLQTDQGRTRGRERTSSTVQPLRLPLQLRWKQCQGMPIGMHSLCSVTLNGKVYVGGGDAYSSCNGCNVMAYDLQSERWDILPEYGADCFRMVVMNNQLVLVGGWIAETGRYVNQLSVWDERSRQWKAELIPPATTPRRSPAVCAYNKWIVVAGGDGQTSRVKTVEIFDTTNKQWYTAAPLPRPCSKMTSAVVGDTWYLLGGDSGPILSNKMAFSCSLPDLISQATSLSQPQQPNELWQQLSRAPLMHSAALALHGSLLAVGGEDLKNFEFQSAIHLYQKGTMKWVKVGDLPRTRSRCSCVPLPSGEFLILGGYQYMDRVDMGTVLNR